MMIMTDIDDDDDRVCDMLKYDDNGMNDDVDDGSHKEPPMIGM
jgi:hypothetical protein